MQLMLPWVFHFIRISPDHGPNTEMIGKNKSNPQSLIQAISFLDKLNAS